MDSKASIDAYMEGRLSKLRLRDINGEVFHNRPALPLKLDANMKHINTFIRKIRMVADHKWSELEGDFDKLNLSRYNSEVVKAICEAKVTTLSHISTVVSLCSRMHQRYSEFTEPLISNLLKLFNDDSDVLKEKDVATKKRSVLRLLTELFFANIISDPNIIISLLKSIMKSDKSTDNNHNALALIVSFCKYGGEDFLGVLSRKRKEELVGINFNDINFFVDSVIQSKLRSYLYKYYDYVGQRYVKLYKRFKIMEAEDYNTQMIKGVISEKRTQKSQDTKDSFERIERNMIQFGEFLDRDLPELPPEDSFGPSKVAISTEITERASDKVSFYDDESTRAFYEDLPDLRAILPKVLLENTNIQDDKKDEEIEVGNEESDKKETKEVSALDILFQSIPSSLNRDAIDELAEKFCRYNSKSSRRALARAALNNRSIQAIPYFSRLVATLSKAFPSETDAGKELMSLLKGEFWRLLKRKDQFKRDIRIRNGIFFAELIKFGICTQLDFFNMANALFHDFHHLNVDILCSILDNCGRVLYLNPETHIRVKSLLDGVIALKKSKGFDPTQEAMIENAYYACNPSDIPVRAKKKSKTPLQRWIQYLLYQKLDSSSIEATTVQFRKLPWDAECAAFVCKAIFKIHRFRFDVLSSLACLVFAISNYYPIVVPLIDSILEEIRTGLEHSKKIPAQRRAAYVAFLGELYNFNLVNSQVIFDTLYLLITFGHSIDKNGQLESDIDARDDCSRVMQVVTLLDTCGHYFNRGAGLHRLFRFLIFFQRYCFLKNLIPIDLEFALQDLYDKIAPDMKRCVSLDEVDNEIKKLDAKNSNLDKLAHLSNLPNKTDMDIHQEEDEDESGGCSDEMEEISDDGSEDDADEYSRPKTLEDVQFENEFDSLMRSSIVERQYEPRIANLPEASTFAGSLLKKDDDIPNSKVFCLVTKHHNKTQYKDLHVPIDCEFIKTQKNASQEQQKEHAERKRLLIAGLQSLDDSQQSSSLTPLPEFDMESRTRRLVGGGGGWSGGLDANRLIEDATVIPTKRTKIKHAPLPLATTTRKSSFDELKFDED